MSGDPSTNVRLYLYRVLHVQGLFRPPYELLCRTATDFYLSRCTMWIECNSQETCHYLRRPLKVFNGRTGKTGKRSSLAMRWISGKPSVL